MKKSFDVYFAGELLEGQDPEQVKRAVGERFGLSGPKLEALFSGVPVRVKKNLDVEKAGRYRKLFLEMGALVQIVPAGREPAAPPTRREAEERPASGQGGALGLAPLSPLQPAEPDVAQADFDTSGLSLSAPGQGSPEEGAAADDPAPLPDISGLSLAPMEERSAEEAEAAPPPPDTSHLEALPPNSGSLEDCAPRKEPVPLPDIDGLSLEK